MEAPPSLEVLGKRGSSLASDDERGLPPSPNSLPPSAKEKSGLPMHDDIRLDLQNYHLTAIPKEIGKLTTLQMLYLSKNSLTEVSPEIQHLQCLEILYLYDNIIRELPPEIGMLRSLKKLSLWNNKLTSLPNELGNLSELIELDASNNYLEHIPDSIGNLTKLDSVFLAKNKLLTLPHSIGNCQQIVNITLQDNNLQSLPNSLWQLDKLETLNLDNNPGLQPGLLERYQIGPGAVLDYLKDVYLDEKATREERGVRMGLLENWLGPELAPIIDELCEAVRMRRLMSFTGSLDAVADFLSNEAVAPRNEQLCVPNVGEVDGQFDGLMKEEESVAVAAASGAPDLTVKVQQRNQQREAAILSAVSFLSTLEDHSDTITHRSGQLKTVLDHFEVLRSSASRSVTNRGSVMLARVHYDEFREDYATRAEPLTKRSLEILSELGSIVSKERELLQTLRVAAKDVAGEYVASGQSQWESMTKEVDVRVQELKQITTLSDTFNKRLDIVRKSDGKRGEAERLASEYETLERNRKLAQVNLIDAKAVYDKMIVQGEHSQQELAAAQAEIPKRESKVRDILALQGTMRAAMQRLIIDFPELRVYTDRVEPPSPSSIRHIST